MFSKHVTVIALLIVALFGTLSVNTGFAQRSEPVPDAIKDIGVDEKPDNPVPLDLTFKNERGQDIQLKDYFDGEHPVLLTLVYYECPMLCNVILDGVVDTLQKMKLQPGQDFEIVTASFNPLESPTTAQVWKQKYIKDYEKPAAARGWHFLTGKKKEIDALADAVGFRFKWVEKRQQFAHPAAIFVLTPEGHVSRYLYGIQFDPKTMRLSLVEASQGKIGTTLDKFILTCYSYDDTEGKYAPVAMNIMRVGGGLTVLILGAALAVFWIREHRKAQAEPEAEGAQT